MKNIRFINFLLNNSTLKIDFHPSAGADLSALLSIIVLNE